MCNDYPGWCIFLVGCPPVYILVCGNQLQEIIQYGIGNPLFLSQCIKGAKLRLSVTVVY